MAHLAQKYLVKPLNFWSNFMYFLNKNLISFEAEFEWVVQNA